MATTLPAGAVAVNILGNDAQFQQTINQVNKSVQNFQKNIQKIDGFKGKWAWFRDLAVTAAAADHVIHRVFGYVRSAIKSAITDMATFGDTYAKMSRRVGMGAKDLSLLGYAAEQSGASVSALGDGMKFLNRNIALAGQGSKAAQDAFAAIGIDSNRLQALDKKEQFLQVADAIQRLGDEAKQTDDKQIEGLDQAWNHNCGNIPVTLSAQSLDDVPAAPVSQCRGKRPVYGIEGTERGRVVLGGNGVVSVYDSEQGRMDFSVSKGCRLR